MIIVRAVIRTQTAARDCAHNFAREEKVNCDYSCFTNGRQACSHFARGIEIFVLNKIMPGLESVTLSK